MGNFLLCSILLGNVLVNNSLTVLLGNIIKHSCTHNVITSIERKKRAKGVAGGVNPLFTNNTFYLLFFDSEWEMG